MRLAQDNDVVAGFLFRKVAREQVSIEFMGNKILMSRFDAYLRSVCLFALKNTSAAQLLDQLR